MAKSKKEWECAVFPLKGKGIYIRGATSPIRSLTRSFNIGRPYFGLCDTSWGWRWRFIRNFHERHKRQIGRPCFGFGDAHVEVVRCWGWWFWWNFEWIKVAAKTVETATFLSLAFLSAKWDVVNNENVCTDYLSQFFHHSGALNAGTWKSFIKSTRGGNFPSACIQGFCN